MPSSASPPTEPPPLSHTTLFRSVLRAQLLEPRIDHRELVEVAVAGGAGERELLDRRRQAALQRVELALGLVLQEALAEERVGLRLDRKSTRLNSSHRTISYAVFCLATHRAPPSFPHDALPICTARAAP